MNLQPMRVVPKKSLSMETVIAVLSKGSTKEPPEKSMFVPVKKDRKHKSDQIASTVDLIRSVIKNDPRKQLLEGIHEEMKIAWCI